MVKKNKKKKKVLSPAERALRKLQNDHRSFIRGIFRQSGFYRVTGIADKQFNFKSQAGDIDDVFIYENVVVAAEYTCAKDVGGHLKPKKILFDKIAEDPNDFINFLRKTFPDSASQFDSKYHESKIVFRLIYCSRYDFEAHYKENIPGPVYLDYPAVRYFAVVADAIRISARFELLNFLGIEPKDVGSAGKISVASSAREYRGSILPEAHSNFDPGYKVVTFYIDPEALLRTAYVLRRDGWQDSLSLYQRMISKKKIEKIRTYLKKERRVFINNIIMTLPPDIKPLNDKHETINTSTLNETAPVVIKLPDRPNSVGLIDGQHRVFSYHQTSDDDQDIAQLRVQQNLLATGIIYPQGITATEREKFEARLFLEINSTQTAARPELKQAIGLLLDPFATESIASRVLAGLAKQGPLSGHVEQYFFDADKLKTASIVSFGLKPLVKMSGNDSIFSIWNHKEKSSIASGSNEALLEEYIGLCVTKINEILGAVKANISAVRWTTDKKEKKKVLSTTYVNCFLILGRLLISEGKLEKQAMMSEKLSGLDNFPFATYRSSQYKRMAEKILEKYF